MIVEDERNFFVEIRNYPHRLLSKKESVQSVIMHYPKTEQGWRELQKRIASVHAEAVEQYLNKLPCPKEQKLALLKAVQDDIKNGK